MEGGSDGAGFLATAQMLHGIQTSKWMAVVTHTLFAYDLILTSQEEYRFVWKASWSIGKLLYFLVRYPYNTVLLLLAIYSSFAEKSNISIAFCKGVFYWEDFGWWVQLVIVKVIIGLRTAALYEWKLRIIVLIGCLGCVSAITIFIVDIITAKNSLYSTFALEGAGNGCKRACSSCLPLFRTALLPTLVFEMSLFFLTLYRYNQNTGQNTPLLRLLYQDGFIYFAAIFCCMLVIVLIFNTAQLAILSVTVPFIRSILGIMCGRFMLKLRGVLLQPPEHLVSTSQSQGLVKTSATLGTWKVASGQLESAQEGTHRVVL